MSRTSILAIFAAVGVTFTGAVTTDAVAFARAVTSGDGTQLDRFARQYPASPYKSDAIRIACQTNWVNGACRANSDNSGVNSGSTGNSFTSAYGGGGGGS